MLTSLYVYLFNLEVPLHPFLWPAGQTTPLLPLSLFLLSAREFSYCINSCLCCTGDHSTLKVCLYCREPCYTSTGEVQCKFLYLSLIPRLQAFYQSTSMTKDLKYQANFIYNKNIVGDVFSAEGYRTMLRTTVTVDGHQLDHTFFSNDRNIAFGLCTDGFLLFGRKRGGPSATPLLVKVNNLSPKTYTHLENLLCLGVILGPHQLKDLGSFLQLFDDECTALAYGVSSFDCVKQQVFDLHAYQLIEEGDIIAVEKFL